MTHLSSLVTEFCEDRTAEGLSHHTVASYRQTLSHFVSFVGGDTDPSEVTRKTVKSFLADRRQRGEATATLGGRHASLSAFWSWLVAEEEATDNVVKKVTRPKDKIKPVPLVTEAEMSALLGIEGKTPFLTFRNRCILMILWDTGVRVGELTSLTLEDIDFEQMMLTVRGKTGQRDVPFGKATGVTLRRYLRRRQYHPKHTDPRVFVGAKGPISEGMVLVMVREYGKKVGVSKLHPHRFRHTWVHNMLEAEATVMDVQVLGGWSSPTQIMNRYGIAGKKARAIAAHRRLSPGDRLVK